MINAVGREIPDHIPGYRKIIPFGGSSGASRRPVGKAQAQASADDRTGKLLSSIDAALDECRLSDGATISFHHHLRNGDGVLNMVLAAIARRGLRDIKVAASSLFPVHAPVVDHIRSGVVTGISATYIAGPVGESIARGELAEPVRMLTHGGRARAIEVGELDIDVAFVAAPTADCEGNINGVEGPAACGTLGYALVDVRHAKRVVAITDHVVPYPALDAQITQDWVDYVVKVASIGDPKGIVSGTTRATTDPVGVGIARRAAQVIAASGLLRDGFSFQTGAGGISLAVAAELRDMMLERGITGSFASGGITSYLVDMFERGLFRALLDVQCFDLTAVDSFRRNAAHREMSASLYANPHNRGPVVDKLDVVILGAAEIDTDFNVNVTTGATGVILGGSGGHADTAAGAKVAIVTTRVNAGAFPKVVERVAVVTTPGESIDVLVTDVGIAVNPRRPELADRLVAAGLPVVPIESLRLAAEERAGRPAPLPPSGRIVAVVEYRDGSVIDVVRAISGDPRAEAA